MSVHDRPAVRSVADAAAMHDALSDAELDGLPYGAILLDRDGRILRYNRTEGQLAGLEPVRVLGRHFFTEVAPCTNVREFAGRFRDCVARGDLQTVFRHRFAFAKGPVDVEITMLSDANSAGAWVFVSLPGDTNA